MLERLISIGLAPARATRVDIAQAIRPWLIKILMDCRRYMLRL
jgi:hypothetical protein